MESAIVIEHFAEHEIWVIKQCLEVLLIEADRDNRFDADMVMYTSYHVADYKDSLETFGAREFVTREDLERIKQLVMYFAACPGPGVEQLLSWLDFPRLHLWRFVYRLDTMRDDWDRFVEDNANVISRSKIDHGDE